MKTSIQAYDYFAQDGICKYKRFLLLLAAVVVIALNFMML